MYTAKIVSAWRDEDYLDTLSSDEKAALPASPVGAVKLAVVEPVGEKSTFISNTCSTFISDCCSTFISNTCSTFISDCCS